MIFFKGLIVGLAIAAPIGPVGLLCIQRSVASGTLAGVITGLGAAVADALCGAVVIIGLSFVATLLDVGQGWTQILGGLILWVFGWRVLTTHGEINGSLCSLRDHLASCTASFTLTATNPATLIAFIALASVMGLDRNMGLNGTTILLIAGIFLGSMLWWFILAKSAQWMKNRVSGGGSIWVRRIAGVLLLGCGLVFLSKGLNFCFS